jgi:hypothetical protein
MDSMLAKTARDGCNRETGYSNRELTASVIGPCSWRRRFTETCKLLLRMDQTGRVPASMLLLVVALLARIHIVSGLS